MHNGKVHGHGYSGNLAEGTLTAFHFDYRRGRTHGDIQVSSFVGADRKWGVRIDVHEY